MLIHFAAVLYLVGVVSSQTNCSAVESVSQLKVVSISGSIISIQWRAPSNTDCLEGYKVCWSLENGTQSNCTTQSRHEHSTTNITGLSPCTSYIINVTSVGSTGESSQAVGTTATSAPDKVSQLKVTSTSVSTISIQWRPPSNADCLVAYQVCCSLADGTQSNCTTQTRHEHAATNITGLSPCTNFIVNVTTIGSSGNSSEAVDIAVSSVPEKVAGLETTGTSVSTITIQWHTPSNTECLQGYLVCWSLVDGDDNGCATQTRHEHATRNLTGLTQCGRYSISVTVVSSSNDYSEATNTTAFSNPPLRRVSNVRALETSSTSFLVEWDLLTEDAECLVDYAVCWGTGIFRNNCSSHPLDLAPAINFTGLKNCATYSFTLTARDESGESAANTISAILPLTPGNVSSLETQSVGPSVIATWTPPSYRPECVVQYEICWESSPGNQNCTVQESSATTFDITELTPCSEYIVGVRALGQPGNSSRVNTTANTAPKSARNLTFSFANATSIVAEWEAPSDQSDCINYYQACLVVAGKTVCVNQTRDITTAYISDLRSCTSYAVGITAWTDGARSSVLSEQVDTTAAVPDVPNHLHVNYAETDLLNVQWRVPTVNYECVQGYIVCWRSSGDQTEGCLNTTNLEQVITGLTPCMNYSINITAVGAIGVSQTAHMSARTRSQAFNDISILEVKSSNSTTLEVEWKAPIKNSECVQEYKVCWIGQETGEEGCTIQTRAITNATITGLISCVNYTVNVTARGDLKNSSAVFMPVMTNSTLIQDKPAIQNLSLSRDSESNITVTWHPLAEGMMCVRSYNVCWEQQSHPEDSQCLELPSSEDHLTISGLHSGTTYTVEVSAVLVTGETSEIIREDIPISGSLSILTSPMAIIISLFISLILIR